jgi:hypothetical protein
VAGFVRRRATHLLSNTFELWAGFAAIVSGVAFFADSSALVDSSVGRAAGVLAYGWNGMYLVSGLLVVVALLAPVGVLAPRWSARAEVAGLAMLAGAALVHAGATVAIRGAPSLAVAATYVGLAAAAGSRVFLLWRLALINRAGRR